MSSKLDRLQREYEKRITHGAKTAKKYIKAYTPSKRKKRSSSDDQETDTRLY